MLTAGARLLLALCAGACLWSQNLEATTNSIDYSPVFKPSLEVKPLSGKISVDGRLDDPGWSSAVHITRFHERNPGDNTMPEVPTEVMVTYDDSRLLVAFVCKDDPTTIRATMSQRDQWSGDDAVGIYLDSYGDGAWAYQLWVNPYGIQRDMLWTTFGNNDLGFDVIWQSAARRTDSGWVAEMAIPFASIRFPDKPEQSWRVELIRQRPRGSVYQYSWGAFDRNDQCFPCQWGTFSGIAGVHAGKGVEVLPAVVAHQTGELLDHDNLNAPLKNETAKGEVSLGAKYSISSDMTLEGAINPDFSQIEADAAQILVNSTISFLYPERRPFFQEGADIFSTLFNSFYSRTINDPDVTAKFTSRHGRTRIGVLSAYDKNSPYIIPMDASNIFLDADKSLVNVLRGARQFGRNSQVGFMLTDRRFDIGGSGSIVSLDGNFRPSRTTSFVGQYIMSFTDEPVLGSSFGGSTFDEGRHTVALDGEKYHGHAFITNFNERHRHWGIFVGYNQITPSYRTQTGFDPVANHRTMDLNGSITILPKSGPFQEIDPGIYYGRRWDYSTGVCRYHQFNASVDVTMKFAQTHIGANIQQYYERWNDTPFDQLNTVGMNLDTRLSSTFGGGGYLNWGKGLARFVSARANQVQYGAYLNLKPIDRLTVNPSLDYFRMTRLSDGDRYFSGYVTRTRAQFQATRALSARLVVQYDDFARSWDFDPLFTYRLNPFTVLYVGSTVDYAELSDTSVDPIQHKWRTTHRQVFMKLQYLLQV